jgi:hypothetical protein
MLTCKLQAQYIVHDPAPIIDEQRSASARRFRWDAFERPAVAAPSIKKCSEPKPPEHLGTANLSTFQKVPAAAALSLLLLHFCDIARLRIDFGFSAEGVYLLQHAAKKTDFCDRHHIASATAALNLTSPMVPPNSAPPTRGFFTLDHRGEPSGGMGTIQPMVGGWVGDTGGRFMNNVLSLKLARERARQLRGGSIGHAFKTLAPSGRNPKDTQRDGQSASTQRFLERLEAENAQLRGSVVELALQIQALRDRAETLTA